MLLGRSNTHSGLRIDGPVEPSRRKARHPRSTKLTRKAAQIEPWLGSERTSSRAAVHTPVKPQPRLGHLSSLLAVSRVTARQPRRTRGFCRADEREGPPITMGTTPVP